MQRPDVLLPIDAAQKMETKDDQKTHRPELCRRAPAGYAGGL
jgi:hypothetical protein